MPETPTANQTLDAARRAKNDEFYTPREDVDAELRHYTEALRGKKILLPCDGPDSAFVKVFVENFREFGLASLTASYYNPDGRGGWFTMDKPGQPQWKPLQGDGDFRSDEVTGLKDAADVVITNPPFSLWRAFYDWVGETDFLLVGTLLAARYVNVWPGVQAGRVRLGVTHRSGGWEFRLPDTATKYDRIDAGTKYGRVNGRWWTTLDHGYTPDPIPLRSRAENLTDGPKKIRDTGYQQLSNVKALHVPVTAAIPGDYDGVMAVPVSYLSKHNPEQFEVLGLAKDNMTPPEYRVGGDRRGPYDHTGKAVFDRILIRHRQPTETPETSTARKALAAARRAKNDEWHTLREDVDAELRHYTKHFRGKRILLPCDGPDSAFTKVFVEHFQEWGLTSLTASYYNADGQGGWFTMGSPGIPQWKPLQGDGDFRSPELTALRDAADIVVTNPPFSLWREFYDWVGETDFLLVGTLLAAAYKNVWPDIQAGRVRLGVTHRSGDVEFRLPDYETKYHRIGDDGAKYARVPGVRWWTNLDHGYTPEPIPLKSRAENLVSGPKRIKETDYFQLSNIHALHVPVTRAIPSDYKGLMAVPISFLSRYNPEQFELLGMAKDILTPTEYLVNPADPRRGTAYDHTGKAVFARILIRRRQPTETPEKRADATNCDNIEPYSDTNPSLVNIPQQTAGTAYKEEPNENDSLGAGDHAHRQPSRNYEQLSLC